MQLEKKLLNLFLNEIKPLGDTKILDDNKVEIENGIVSNTFFIIYDNISSITGNILIELENKKITDADYSVIIVNEYYVPLIYITSSDRLREFIKGVPPIKIKKEIGEKKCIYVYEKQRILRDAFLLFADWFASYKKIVLQDKE